MLFIKLGERTATAYLPGAKEDTEVDGYLTLDSTHAMPMHDDTVKLGKGLVRKDRKADFAHLVAPKAKPKK